MDRVEEGGEVACSSDSVSKDDHDSATDDSQGPKDVKYLTFHCVDKTIVYLGSFHDSLRVCMNYFNDLYMATYHAAAAYMQSSPL
jgi:hypothetical protein